jgi:serine/threonine-protein kinase
MLAGSPPFEGETALSVAVQHMKKQPNSLENLRPDLPPALCRIVHRMLSKAPENRYQSARELLRELRQLQLEHFDEEWPEDLPGWEITELDTAGLTRHETTQRLDSLMKTAAQGQQRGARLVAWGAGVVGAFLLGAALAFPIVWEPSLLAVDENAAVPVHDSVDAQWFYAMQEPSNEAWQAVIDNFPDESVYVNGARKQLSMNYLRDDDYEKALDVFHALAVMDDEPELRAFGLAGQCWVWTLTGESQKAAQALDEFMPLLLAGKLTDPGMAELLRRGVLETLRQQPGAVNAQEALEYLEQLDEEAGEGD